jgi:glycosyltransferase involved in cell wall biosynthesis
MKSVCVERMTDHFDKIVITGGREVGGLAAFAAGLAEGFSSLGVRSEVISPAEVWKRARELRDPNVLKILSTTAAFAAPLGRSIICVAHGVPRADVQGWARMLAVLGSFKVANTCSDVRLVAVSDYVASHLSGPFKLRIDGVIRNPVRSVFLEPFDEPGERPYLTYVGRLFSAKNVHRLLPAMCELQRQCPEMRICIIGDGPQRKSLEDSFGRRPGIEFTGDLEPAKVRAYLRRSKVFVSGNELEPFGITYLEALSQGCAVAMPACGGGLEIALELFGTSVHLLPLSFDRELVRETLRRAWNSSVVPVSLAAYAPAAVASAYQTLGAGIVSGKTFPATAGEQKCPSSRYA